MLKILIITVICKWQYISATQSVMLRRVSYCISHGSINHHDGPAISHAELKMSEVQDCYHKSLPSHI